MIWHTKSCGTRSLRPLSSIFCSCARCQIGSLRAVAKLVPGANGAVVTLSNQVTLVRSQHHVPLSTTCSPPVCGTIPVHVPRQSQPASGPYSAQFAFGLSWHWQITSGGVVYLGIMCWQNNVLGVRRPPFRVTRKRQLGQHLRGLRHACHSSIAAAPVRDCHASDERRDGADHWRRSDGAVGAVGPVFLAVRVARGW